MTLPTSSKATVDNNALRLNAHGTCYGNHSYQTSTVSAALVNAAFFFIFIKRKTACQINYFDSPSRRKRCCITILTFDFTISLASFVMLRGQSDPATESDSPAPSVDADIAAGYLTPIPARQSDAVVAVGVASPTLEAVVTSLAHLTMTVADSPRRAFESIAEKLRSAERRCREATERLHWTTRRCREANATASVFAVVAANMKEQCDRAKWVLRSVLRENELLRERHKCIFCQKFIESDEYLLVNCGHKTHFRCAAEALGLRCRCGTKMTKRSRNAAQGVILNLKKL